MEIVKEVKHLIDLVNNKVAGQQSAQSKVTLESKDMSLG